MDSAEKSQDLALRFAFRGESYRPDLSHPGPIEPHWDYKAPDGTWYRIFSDGEKIPKK